MNRRRARHMSRNARQRAAPAIAPRSKGCARCGAVEEKLNGRCVGCGTLSPYAQLPMGLQSLIGTALNFEVRHVPALDESPPERETFSGGVNLSARERNLARLRYFVLRNERLIVVGKYTLALFKEQFKPNSSPTAQERAERNSIRERMSALGLSTEGLR